MFLIYKGSTAVYDPGKGTHRGIVSMKTETKQAGKQRNRVSSPFSLTLTTRWCLLQRRRWPGSVLMPGKCSLRAGTGVLVYCGHCVVCTQLGLLLTLGGFRAGGIGAFSCAGFFSLHPINILLYGAASTHSRVTAAFKHGAVILPPVK